MMVDITAQNRWAMTMKISGFKSDLGCGAEYYFNLFIGIQFGVSDISSEDIRTGRTVPECDDAVGIEESGILPDDGSTLYRIRF